MVRPSGSAFSTYIFYSDHAHCVRTLKLALEPLSVCGAFFLSVSVFTEDLLKALIFGRLKLFTATIRPQPSLNLLQNRSYWKHIVDLDRLKLNQEDSVSTDTFSSYSVVVQRPAHQATSLKAVVLMNQCKGLSG